MRLASAGVLSKAAAVKAAACDDGTPGSHPFIAGVVPHMAWGIPSALVTAKMAELGTRSFRDEASWNAYERQKGVYDVRGLSASMQEALAGRIDVSNSILLLDYGNHLYSNGSRPIGDDHIQAFVGYAVNLIKDGGWRFGFIEVWNEWNIAIGGGDHSGGSGADYARLFKAVAQAIRPLGNFRILTGGGVDLHDDFRFQRDIVDHGVLQYADGYGHHSYNWSDRAKATPLRQMERLNQIQSFLTRANGGKQVPIYLTEAGWPNWSDSRYSDTQVGQWTAEFLQLARATGWIKGVWIYNLLDKGGNFNEPEEGFGIYGTDGQAKPRTALIRSAVSSANR